MKLISGRGDSLERGSDFFDLTGGKFGEALEATSPFYSQRTPAVQADVLLGVNGSPLRAYYAGSLFSPSVTMAQEAALGRVGHGSIIFCEDAGDIQNFNPDVYQAAWESALQEGKDTGARVIAQTTLDTSTSAWQAIVLAVPGSSYGLAPLDSRFETNVVTGSPSGIPKSPNQCIRDAAASVGVELYDWDARALTFAQSAAGSCGMRVVQTDWIHFTYWLGLHRSYDRLKFAGLGDLMPSAKAIDGFVDANWSLLGYNVSEIGSSFAWTKTLAFDVLGRALA